jgi:hypothetical protein
MGSHYVAPRLFAWPVSLTVILSHAQRFCAVIGGIPPFAGLAARAPTP